MKHHTNVIGIVIGVCFSIALFVVIAVVVCFCYRRRKVKKGEPLRFPNPTFGLPGGLKSVKVDGAATKWRSEEPLTTVGASGSDKLEPNRFVFTSLDSFEQPIMIFDQIASMRCIFVQALRPYEPLDETWYIHRLAVEK